MKNNPFLTAKLSFMQQRPESHSDQYGLGKATNTTRESEKSCCANPFRREQLLSPEVSNRSHGRSQSSFSLNKSKVGMKLTARETERERAKEEQMEKHRKIVSAYGIESLRYTRPDSQMKTPFSTSTSTHFSSSNHPTFHTFSDDYHMSNCQYPKQKVIQHKYLPPAHINHDDDSYHLGRIRAPEINRSRDAKMESPTFKNLQQLKNMNYLEESSMSDMIGDMVQEKMSHMSDYVIEKSSFENFDRRESNFFHHKKSKFSSMGYQSNMSSFYEEVEKNYAPREKKFSVRTNPVNEYPNQIFVAGELYEKVDML